MVAIYKILTAGQWADFQRLGVFDGAPVDLTDGFIHLSTAQQVRETAAKHFAGQANLVLVAVEADQFDSSVLKWEPSRGGALFPHLYASLKSDDIIWARDLPLGEDGLHQFPSDVAE